MTKDIYVGLVIDERTERVEFWMRNGDPDFQPLFAKFGIRLGSVNGRRFELWEMRGSCSVRLYPFPDMDLLQQLHAEAKGGGL